jgi:hypothetical protein
MKFLRMLTGLSVFIMSCEQVMVVKRFPKIAVIDDMGVERTSVDFQEVQLNTKSTKTLRVRNTGNLALTISKIEFSKPIFAQEAMLPLTIDVDSQFDVPLTFTPNMADIRETGTVTFSSDDVDKPAVVVNLAGTGVSALALIQPGALNFQDVYVNETKSLMISITNSGSNPLVVSDVKFASDGMMSFSADFAPLKKTLAKGESASAQITFAPKALGPFTGSIQVVLPTEIGNKTVTLTGSGIEAQPKLCFKFDDSPFEQCADVAKQFFEVAVGSLCDSTINPPGPDAGVLCRALDGGQSPYNRKGQFYIRNEGNTPVSYTMAIDSQLGNQCDGGGPTDFDFENLPLQSDGGRVVRGMIPQVKLPTMVSAPKPWETMPVKLSYQARSRCRDDAADQARIVWTRQGEPLGGNRQPQSMIMNFNGKSLLPRGVAQDVNLSGTVPLSLDFYGVGNVGEAPLKVTSVQLWQSEFLLDGGRGTVPFELCDSSTAGDCRFFSWEIDPASKLPLFLKGTGNSSLPSTDVLGKVRFGGSADGGVSPQVNRDYSVFAVIETGDPYSPQVIAKVKGRASQ